MCLLCRTHVSLLLILKVVLWLLLGYCAYRGIWFWQLVCWLKCWSSGIIYNTPGIMFHLVYTLVFFRKCEFVFFSYGSYSLYATAFDLIISDCILTAFWLQSVHWKSVAYLTRASKAFSCDPDLLVRDSSSKSFPTEQFCLWMSDK